MCRVLAIVLMVVGQVFMSTADAQDLARGAVGTWKLVSYTSTAADGTVIQNFGDQPKGIAVFDTAGNFTITIVRADLPPFAENNRERGTADENAAVVRGSIAYFGTYRDEDGQQLLFRITGATLPNWAGTTQRRQAVMPSTRELTLTNLVASGGGRAEIKWVRD